MTNGTEKYIDTVKCLGRLYDFINETLFNGELTKPVITVQRDERNKTCGWWSVKKVWRENTDDEGEHELNITAQELNRPAKDIAETMTHEMCHQYASLHNFQDCSRGGTYHNKLFRKIAETHGLNVECVKTHGWANTSLTPTTAELIDKFVTNNPETVIYRSPVIKGQTKSSSTRKYVCPVCGQSVRATKEIRIICADCNEYMTEE